MSTSPSPAAPRWWQTAVFYQIYPRSFADGNGDGIGDFAGITAKLDYLRDLGVDAIWLSPHFPSPQADCGYDISDYIGVAPEYGTLDDFRTFLAEAHARGIRVVLDMVLNHTSDQHPWFVESRASRTSPKRDWYVWQDGRDGGPPNNWASVFGGSAWEHDAATGQFYYHMFLKEQPDLNWRNPAVKAAMWDSLRFWLDMGVDGFRLDAIATCFEHPDMPDHDSQLAMTDVLRVGRENPTPEEQARIGREFMRMFRYQMQQPGIHELMKELRALVDEYPGDRVLIGEDDDVAYYGSGDDELHLVFNFPLMRTRRISAPHVRANQAERLAALPAGAWPCNTLNNHDTPRLWSAYGDRANDADLARLHAALVLTLRGTPVLYNGEEIGMSDYLVGALEQLRDNQAVNFYHAALAAGASAEQALEAAAQMSRDRCRTPMQWADAPNAGFSPAGVATWLPVNPNYAEGVSVAAQAGDPGSLLSFYGRLIALRREHLALLVGGSRALLEADLDCLAFERVLGEDACLVALNFAGELRRVAPLPGRRGRVLLSSRMRAGESDDLGLLELAPFEVYIAAVDS